jgi:hypothetical protein
MSTARSYASRTTARAPAAGWRWAKVATIVASGSLVLAQGTLTASCFVPGLDPSTERGKTCTSACSTLPCIDGVCGGPASSGTGGSGSNPCNALLDGDATNCGFCGHDCQGTACTNGICGGAPVVAEDVTAMVEDGDVIYLVNYDQSSSTGSVLSYDLAASDNPKTLYSGPFQPTLITASAPYLFWLTNDGVILRAREDGTDTMPTIMAMGESCTCLASNGTTLFWWNDQEGQAYSKPVDSPGAARAVVATAPSHPADGCVAADDTSIGVVTSDAAFTVKLPGGTATQVSPSGGHFIASRIAVAGADVFVLEQTTADNRLHVDHIAPGSTRLDESTSFAEINVMQFVTDGKGIFWATQSPNYVDGCSDALCGAGVHRFAQDAGTPGAMVADATWLYVFVAEDGTIYKFAR